MSKELDVVAGKAKSTTSIKRFDVVMKIPKGAKTKAIEVLDIIAAAGTYVDIVKNSQAGEKTRALRIPLASLIEMATTLEGYTSVSTSGANFVLEFNVPLAASGFEPLKDKEDVSIKFTDLPAGSLVTVWGYPAPKIGSSVYNYETIKFMAGETRELDLTTVKRLGLPVGKVTQLELRFANGQVLTYDEQLITNMLREQNPFCVVYDGLLQTGSYLLHVINVAEILSAKVTLSENASAYTVRTGL